MKNKVNILIFLLLMGCASKEEEVVREICNQYTNEIYDNHLKLKRNIEKYLYVKEEIPYNEYCVFKISESLLFEDDTLKYAKYFKQNNVYVFIDRGEDSNKYVSTYLRDKLPVFSKETNFDPFVYILLVNPKNGKYIVLNDDQRYLSIDSLLKEAEGKYFFNK
ncbi:hypothetical protein LJB94_00960 [Odoribacter sp. OttesenSCG-928-G04]|nr:hypothetical protein [Odoribacter sp. OttesenSCG-928-G04]